MAGETIDALVLSARFDNAGLEALPTAVNAALRKAQQGVPALDINTAPFQASLTKAGISAADFAAGFQDAVNDFGGADALLKQLAQDTEAAAAGSQKMAAGFATAGQAAKAAAAGSQAWERGLANIRAANDGAASGFAASTRATNLLRGGLTQLAVQALGTSGALGQVGQAAAFAAGGTGAVLAVGALALAYGVLTKSTREAREEQERLLQAQRQRLTAGGGEDATARTTIAADEARIRDITKEIAGWQQTIVQDAVRGIPTYLEELRVRKLIAEQRQVELALAADQAALDQRHSDEIAASLQRQQTQRIGALTAAPDLGLADVGTFREIRAEMAKQLEIVNAEGVALVDRIEAQQTYNRLQEALLVPMREAEARQRAETEAIESSVRAQEDFLSALERTNAERGKEIAAARQKQVQILAPAGFDDSLTRGFEEAAEAASKIKTPADLEDDLNAAADAAERLAAALAQAAQEEADALRASEKAFKTEKIEESVHAVQDLVFVLGSAVDALGLMDQQASQALRSMEALGVAIASGDIAGAIGAGLGILGSVFGKDQTQVEHERIQQANTDALERNTTAVEAAAEASRVSDFDIDLTRFGPLFRAFESGGGLGGQGMELATNALARAAEEAGTSLDELQRVAEANGIQLLDSKGRIVAGAFDALTVAIQQHEDAITHFGTTVDDIAAREATRDALGLSDRSTEPRTQTLERARDVQLEGLELDPALEARIKALDLSTIEGREKFLEFERDLFKRAEAGTLTPEELGAFGREGGVDALNKNINSAADAANAFADAAADAAGKLGDFNLPAGFKRQALAFQASPFGERPNDGASLPLPGQPPLRGTDINVNVTVDPASAPADVRRAAEEGARAGLAKGLRGIGLVQSGDTMQLGVR